MSEPEILLEETSPHGGVYAIAEQNERCCYFYLNGEKDSSFELKSCWVRNLVPAPAELEVEKMREGEPPLLPRQYCLHPEGAPAFREGELGLIWAEEGDAAALTQGGEIIAVIPSWSGMTDFSGFARDCIRDRELARPRSPSRRPGARSTGGAGARSRVRYTRTALSSRDASSRRMPPGAWRYRCRRSHVHEQPVSGVARREIDVGATHRGE